MAGAARWSRSIGDIAAFCHRHHSEPFQTEGALPRHDGSMNHQKGRDLFAFQAFYEALQFRSFFRF